LRREAAIDPAEQERIDEPGRLAFLRAFGGAESGERRVA
jgi:hypothetical protein